MAAKPVVICGPSGVGKSTLLKKLMSDFSEYLGFSVSHTTRKPRPGEQDGVHYYFVGKDQIKNAIESGELIEHAQFASNTYGTSRRAVEDVIKANKMCILDIEMEGVKQVKSSNIHPLYIFVKPPSIESLEQRLRSRGTETDESLAQRLAVAQKEIAFGLTEGNFDIVVTNDEVDKAYEQLKKFLLPHLEQLKEKSS